MALTDIFTGQAYKDAAAQQRQFLAQQAAQNRADIQAGQTAGLGALQAGQTGALGAVAPAIAQGRTDIAGGVNPAISALYGGQDLASLSLTGSVDPAIAALTGGVGAATSAYQPLYSAAQGYGGAAGQASQTEADALGLNGPEGVARAQQQFQAGPGFQFALNTGLDALTRSANAAGGGNALGGNLLRQAQTFGQGMGQQEWNNFIQNLKSRQQLYAPLQSGALGTAAGGVANAALTGGTGAANIYTGTGSRLSDLFAGTGARAAPVYTGAAQSLADLAKTGGLSEAGIYTGTGQSSADLIKALTGQQVASTQALAGPYASTYGAEAAAQTQGAGNLFNLGLSALGLGTNLMGGLGSLGYKPFAPGQASSTASGIGT